MTPPENASERLHVMVTPTQKRLLAEAAELRGFRSEGSVVRHLIDEHVASLIQAGGKPAADYTGRTRLLVDTARKFEPFDTDDEELQPYIDAAARRIRPTSLGPVRIPRALVERSEPIVEDELRESVRLAGREIIQPGVDPFDVPGAPRITTAHEAQAEADFEEMTTLLRPHMHRLRRELRDRKERNHCIQSVVVVPVDWGDAAKCGGTLFGTEIVVGEVESPVVADKRPVGKSDMSAIGVE